MTYDRPSQILHWVIGISLLLMIFVHPSTEHGNQPPAWLVLLHANAGVGLLLLIIFRLVWRLRFATLPQPNPSEANKQRQLKKAVHAALYFLMVITPVVGIALALTSQLTIQLLGITLPTLNATLPFGLELSAVLQSLHGSFANAILLLAVGHIVMALYHQFYRKDQTLMRMLR